MAVVVETSLGDITIDLYVKQRPKCCFNFLKLCKIKYYNYCMFFEIKKNFTARSGDPTNQGDGGQSIYAHSPQSNSLFEAESAPRIKHSRKGLISMVNNGKSLHGSQFFITMADDLDFLDKQGHTVFGYVAEGSEVLERLNQLIVDSTDRPFQDTCISHSVILEDPFDDPKWLTALIPCESPDIPDSLLDSNRIGLYEDIDEEGLTEEEIVAKEAKTSALILEMIGDLPNADTKPPENVLFICRLNPITKEADLCTIFSRFGRIVSCDVIRDKKTGHSKQYGFIEFESREDCEKAFFKMENVLIDDRRVHVDFCQSVAKDRRKRIKR
ncbi:Peptidyl-prolyl cis-trans isomerase-like 4, partial [Fragariocoptes setiger]